jgi:Matrixin
MMRTQYSAKRLPGRSLATAAALVTGLYAGGASAYCRTTTCDPGKDVCTKDENGCLTAGLPLYWPDLCVTFAVDEKGSALRGITYDEASDVVSRAFQAWISADCGGGRHPSIGVVPLGVSYCDKVEYNFPRDNDGRLRTPNANIIIFRDDAWLHTDEDSTLALTTVTFSKNTGEILDADIEVNSHSTQSLSTGDTDVTNDLQSILTHEVGHFLGLAHSKAKGASMNPEYKVHLGDITFRSLSPDDQEAVCSVYPPQAEDITDCTGEGPRFGFSRTCGVQTQADASLLCSYTPHAGSTFRGLGLAGALGALGASWLRRRRKTPQRATTL